MYVVIGATGNTGSVVASRLLDAGKQVRVVVRAANKVAALAKRGAEVAVADLNDEQALERAVRGAEGLYYLLPPDQTSQDFITERKALTAKHAQTFARADVKHVVLLSSIAAQHAAGTGPIVSVHHAEQQLRSAGVPATFVRAAYFMENWIHMLPVAKRDGVLPAFFPIDLRVPMIATPDIGEVAARALLDGPRGVRIIELAGPQETSANDVASALGRILGRSVTASLAPLDSIEPIFTGNGASKNFAQLYRELSASMATGHIAWEGTGEAARGKLGIEEALRPLAG
jgi:uncharacterized protein YbjT (DUF2867 family)